MQRPGRADRVPFSSAVGSVHSAPTTMCTTHPLQASSRPCAFQNQHGCLYNGCRRVGSACAHSSPRRRCTAQEAPATASAHLVLSSLPEYGDHWQAIMQLCKESVTLQTPLSSLSGLDELKSATRSWRELQHDEVCGAPTVPAPVRLSPGVAVGVIPF